MALNASYPWQNEANIYLPGGATSVAHQFLRCVLHQLAPNGIFVQMFQTHADGKTDMDKFLIGSFYIPAAIKVKLKIER